MENAATCMEQIENVLRSLPYAAYDVVIIDGLYRYEAIKVALKCISDTGVIICDDSDGYGFYEGFRDAGLRKVDFFGNAPGVLLPRCTSIYFKAPSFIFNAAWPTPVIAHDKE